MCGAVVLETALLHSTIFAVNSADSRALFATLWSRLLLSGATEVKVLQSNVQQYNVGTRLEFAKFPNRTTLGLLKPKMSLAVKTFESLDPALICNPILFSSTPVCGTRQQQ